MAHYGVSSAAQEAASRERARKAGTLEHDRFHREVSGRFPAHYRSRNELSFRFVQFLSNNVISASLVSGGICYMVYGYILLP